MKYLVDPATAVTQKRHSSFTLAVVGEGGQRPVRLSALLRLRAFWGGVAGGTGRFAAGCALACFFARSNSGPHTGCVFSVGSRLKLASSLIASTKCFRHCVRRFVTQ